MASVIIGIHGLANKPEKQLLSDWWETAIKEGLKKNCAVQNPDFQFIMVYWRDLLYKYPQHREPGFDHDALYNDQPYREAADQALIKYDEGWLDKVRAGIGDIGGSILDSVRGPMGLDSLSGWLLEQKARDLAYYYDKDRKLTGRDGQRKLARQVLMDELMNTILPLKGRRMMLIAHSMGSIIAYDVLRDLGQKDPGFPVHHFVTIGSPLGLGFIKNNIHSERSYSSVPVRTPTVVTEKWVNYADRADPVAVDSHIRDDFGPNDADVQVEDDLIINDYVTSDGVRHPHKSYGYLRTPELSHHIRQFLQV